MEAPGVLLRETPAPRLLIPDVALVRTDAIWSGQRLLGPADVLLVAEIVSPSSQATDRITEPALHAAARAPAYWRLEPDDPAGLAVVTHRLVRDAYVEQTVVHAGQTVELTWPLACRLSPALLTGRPRR